MMGVSDWYDLGHVGLLDKNTTGAEGAPDAREIARIGVMNLEGGMRRLISH